MPSPARTRSVLRHVVGLGVGAALLVFAVPSVGGATWSGVAAVLGAVPATALVVLVVVWLLGLVCHTITLTAALPGLTHRRALTLSLTGSAVANVLPLGGAAGMAMNYRMLRTWGFGRPQFASFTIVSNLWDVVAKLALPVLVLPVVLLSPSVVLPHLALVAVGLAVVLVLAAVGAAVALTSRRGARAVGRAVDGTAARVVHLLGSARRPAATARLVATQESCRGVVLGHWRGLTVGMVLYTVLLFALLWGCLSVSGAGLAVPVVLVGFAVERVATLAGLTPGGAGVVELGLTGVLVLLGGPAAEVVPGVLLYRALTFGLEIPVGGTALVGWLVVRRRAVRREVRQAAALGCVA